MSENIETWKSARLGLDARGSPRVIQLVKEEGQKDDETLRRLSDKFSNIKVKQIRKKNKSKGLKERRNNNYTYNQRWRVLECVRKNEPTTIPFICDEVADGKRYIKKIVYRLENDDWLSKEPNDRYDDGRIKHIYYLGPQAERFLDDRNADSFLWPDNPIDPGENGERLE